MIEQKLFPQNIITYRIRCLATDTLNKFYDPKTRTYRQTLPVSDRERIITFFISAGIDKVSEKDIDTFKAGSCGLYDEPPQGLVRKLETHFGFDPNNRRDLALVLRGALASSIIHSQPQTLDYLKAVDQVESQPFT